MFVRLTSILPNCLQLQGEELIDVKESGKKSSKKRQGFTFCFKMLAAVQAVRMESLDLEQARTGMKALLRWRGRKEQLEADGMVEDQQEESD